MLIALDVGWFIRSHLIMAYEPGPLLWAIQRAVRRMLVSHHTKIVVDLHRLFSGLAPFGSWSDHSNFRIMVWPDVPGFFLGLPLTFPWTTLSVSGPFLNERDYFALFFFARRSGTVPYRHFWSSLTC